MTDSMELLDQKLARYRERGVGRVKLGLTDVDGVIRGKYVSLSKFATLMEKGGGFCDCVFGWDVDDHLYDAGTYTGWHTGFPDAQYRVTAPTASAGSPMRDALSSSGSSLAVMVARIRFAREHS